MLRKGVYPYQYMGYPYQYMGGWQRFNEIPLPQKKNLYINLNMENITNVEYKYAKRSMGRL